MESEAGRLFALATGAMLALLGVLFITLLVVDAGDNAYVFLWLAGAGLLATSPPFLLAAAISRQRARRLVLAVARGIFVAVAALTLLGLAFAVVLVPSQDYESSDVLVAHVAGMILVAIAAVLVLRGPHLISRLRS